MPLSPLSLSIGAGAAYQALYVRGQWLLTFFLLLKGKNGEVPFCSNVLHSFLASLKCMEFIILRARTKNQKLKRRDRNWILLEKQMVVTT